jgi:hypothetical protein
MITPLFCPGAAFARRARYRVGRCARDKAAVILILLFSAARLASAADAQKPAAAAPVKVRHFSAKEVFDYRQPVIFHDDFRSGQFGKWRFSENDNYEILQENPDRIKIMDAPSLGSGRKAVRFMVRRAPDSFRSELSLPHEPGFQERWYGERILVPPDWVFDPERAVDIVMQWHAIPGNWRATFPNLEISIGNTNWIVRQSFGNAQEKPTRTNQKLGDAVQPGQWVSWVVHAKWSPGDAGLLQIWKDHKLVLERQGPNVYSTIGVEYTPYLKTGIYRPEWHLDKPEKRVAFDRAMPVATNKVIYVTDLKIGNERARYEDVAPGRVDFKADSPLPRRVTFGLISDVHQDVMPDGVERIRAFVDAMTKAKPDFILQLGDFCQPKPANRKFLDAWNSFAGPRYHVLGNHDMDGGFTSTQTCAFLGSPAPYYAFTAGPIRGVVLNGNEPGGKATGYKRFIGAEQLAWLERELARSDRPAVIFIHQPMDDANGGSIGLENSAAVRAVIEKASSKVAAVFSGHFHLDYHRVVNGIHHLQINSASYLWLGNEKLARETFPPEIHNAFKSLKNVAAYREPLWALVTLDFERGTLVVEGKHSEWIGPDPWQRGATEKDISRETTRPAISDRRLPLAISAEKAQ